MSRTRAFAQVDVFSATPFGGNPVAVVLDADGLTDEQLQRVALWTNLSETTFVLPPTDDAADYRVRIFTTRRELPFAGHPTLGTAHAWLEAGGRPRREEVVVQECAAGLVDVRRGDGDLLAFAAPPLTRTGPVSEEDLAPFVATLGVGRDAVLDHQWVDNGPGWAVLRLASAEDVLLLEPDRSHAPEAKLGVVGWHPAGSDHLYEVRAFVPGAGIAEDPVTGSLNAGIAQWLAKGGEVPLRYRARQGTAIGRSGTVEVEVDGDGPDPEVWVGGATRTCVRGTVEI